MLSLPRRIWLVILFCILQPLNSFTQINNQTSQDSNIAAIYYMAAHPELPAKITEDEAVTFFINKFYYLNSCYYRTKDGRLYAIDFDSLIPKQKELIDSFIQRYIFRGITNSGELNHKPFEAIYDSITKLSKINFYARSKEQLSKIFSAIIQLSDSDQKVALLLKYYQLQINSDTYWGDILDFLNSVKEYADKIIDVFDRGIAYDNIGYVANSYLLKDFAIYMYYLSRECVANSNKSKDEKYYYQGYICKQLAEVFYRIDLKESLEKSIYYYLNSLTNFYSAGYTDQAESSLFNEISLVTLTHARWKPDSTEELVNAYDKILEILKIWFTALNEDTTGEHLGMDNEDVYLGYYSIAESVSGKSKESALRYYLVALQYALVGLDPDRVRASLTNVASTYASLGEEKMALAYANLQEYFAGRLGDPDRINRTFLNKSTIFLYLKKYDSALVYTDKVLYDTSLKNIFSPTIYNTFLVGANELKYKILDSLKRPIDSIWEYEKSYIQFEAEGVNYFSRLLKVEATSTNEWLERSTKKEMDEKESAARKDKIIIVLCAVIVISISIVIYWQKISKQKDRANKERIKRLQAESAASEQEAKVKQAEIENLKMQQEVSVKNTMAHDGDSADTDHYVPREADHRFRAKLTM